MDLTVIRPLLYMDEADIIGFARANDLPIVKSPCPVDGYTKREYAKNLVKTLEAEHHGARERMFTAIRSGLWKTPNPTTRSKTAKTPS
jgi:tRNA(Ile)-lysidine synthase TilS/MesJ